MVFWSVPLVFWSVYLVFGGMKLVYEGVLWYCVFVHISYMKIQKHTPHIYVGGVFLYFVRISFALVGILSNWDTVLSYLVFWIVYLVFKTVYLVFGIVKLVF